MAQARVGALAARERTTLRAFLWLGRASPVEFQLGFDTSEFLRQELREEHSRFTRRLCLAHRYPDIHSAPETSLLLSNPARIGDIRLHLVGLNHQTKTAQKPKPNAHQDSAQSSAKTQVICLQKRHLVRRVGPASLSRNDCPTIGQPGDLFWLRQETSRIRHIA